MSSDSSSPSTKLTRSRGAQPGNQNAFKHGFYSTAFHQLEIASLRDVPEGVEAEIQMLRLMIRRILHLSSKVKSLDEGLRLLNTLGRATAYLNRLMHTQKIIIWTRVSNPPADMPPLTDLFGRENLLTSAELKAFLVKDGSRGMLEAGSEDE